MEKDVQAAGKRRTIHTMRASPRLLDMRTMRPVAATPTACYRDYGSRPSALERPCDYSSEQGSRNCGPDPLEFAGFRPNFGLC